MMRSTPRRCSNWPTRVRVSPSPNPRWSIRKYTHPSTTAETKRRYCIQLVTPPGAMARFTAHIQPMNAPYARWPHRRKGLRTRFWAVRWHSTMTWASGYMVHLPNRSDRLLKLVTISRHPRVREAILRCNGKRRFTHLRAKGRALLPGHGIDVSSRAVTKKCDVCANDYVNERSSQWHYQQTKP